MPKSDEQWSAEKREGQQRLTKLGWLQNLTVSMREEVAFATFDLVVAEGIDLRVLNRQRSLVPASTSTHRYLHSLNPLVKWNRFDFSFRDPPFPLVRFLGLLPLFVLDVPRHQRRKGVRKRWTA